LRDTSQDGVALVEEGIEGAAKAVVVELVHRDVPEDIGTGFLGPGGDVDQRGGAGEPSGEEQAEDLSVAEFELGVRRQMAVDNLRDLHALQEWTEQGQRTQVDDFFGAYGSIPGEAHTGCSVGQRGPWEDSKAKVSCRDAAFM